MTDIELLIPTKIIYSKRKSLSLMINNQGELIVRAPLKYNDRKIFDFINKKAEWIKEKRIYAIKNIQKPLNIAEHNTLTLLGQTYTISLFSGKTAKIKGNILYIPQEESQHKLKLFLKRFAKKIIAEKVCYFANLHNIKYSSITISSAKTNWGSCSGKNNLHFTYKLMLCPEPVVDYIVNHELAHIIVKNHSSKFWNLVNIMYPNYKQCEKWLKQNRAIVELI